MARNVKKPPIPEHTPQDHDAAYKEFYSLSLVVESVFADTGEALGFDPDFVKKLNLPGARLAPTESIKETATEKGKARGRRHNDLVIEIPSLVDEDTESPLYAVFEFQGAWPADTVIRFMDYYSEVFQRFEKPRKSTDPPPQVQLIVLDHGGKSGEGRKVPKMNIYDNNRPGMQIRGTHPERRLNVLTLNLDGMPMDNPVPAWCHIEQANGDDKKVITVLKAIFTKYSEPEGEENLLCRALYHRATMHGYCCEDGEPVPYEDARRDILGDRDMTYMTNVQRTIRDREQKGERKGIAKGQRDQLCRLAEKKFNDRTSKQLETLLKAVDDPVVLGQVGENIIDCDSGKEFIDACKGLGSS